MILRSSERETNWSTYPLKRGNKLRKKTKEHFHVLELRRKGQLKHLHNLLLSEIFLLISSFIETAIVES